ncbi:MAG: hypothetical protein IJO54_03575, partial [Oscillospiraceae bacterium]|nr:hypothetical protein [Oscillospiraceae bacterium]
EDIRTGNATVSTAKAVSVSLTHTKAKVTQSVREVKLYQNDRYSRGLIRLTISDKAMPKIGAVELAEGTVSEYYELISLGNGWYAVEYKDNTVAPKIKNGTVKLNVYLKGNNTKHENPNATVSVKVTNVKFKSNLR